MGLIACIAFIILIQKNMLKIIQSLLFSYHQPEIYTQTDENHKIAMPISHQPKFLKDIQQKYQNSNSSPSQNSNNGNTKIIQSYNGQSLRYSYQKHRKQMKEFLLEDNQNQNWELQKKTIFLNGNKITGTWKNNQLHGHVTIEYGSGDKFQGIYQRGNRVYGKMTFADGTQYCGEFLGDQIHGKGSITDSKKRVITCTWYLNMPISKVIIEYPSQDIYFGQMLKFQKHGFGYLYFKNGNKYIGHFQNGSITGYGCYYQKNGAQIEGLWNNGYLILQKIVSK